MLRKALCVWVPIVAIAGCAGEASTANKSTTTPASSAGGADFPQSIGVARSDLESNANAVELGSSDCQAACKALASFERAANRLCLVAEPQECSEARVRFDRARRAVMTQCGGC
jgi:hypothetical protein